MGVAVDANVVIAWQNPDHVFHHQAIDLISQAEPPLYMGELNLAEVLVGLDKNDWAPLVKAMTDLGFRFIAPNAFGVASARIGTSLRMPDAYVIATAQSQQTDGVLSFDRSLIATAKSLGFATN
ncbi:MAG: type II toxin-antitoxin system VapC family toxin [Micrococcales bacterium]|nr:type II toxin-antitoxin system VapC family toxin [Micrococcales bacterium]